MKIIISPTKQMSQDNEAFLPLSQPVFLAESRAILSALQALSYQEAKELCRCNEKLATENYDRIQGADLSQQTAPAVMSYKGLQFQYLAPDLLSQAALDYLQKHLRIMSGLYGLLRPFDGIIPYRLEMQAPLAVAGTKNLYHFWGERLYQALDFSEGPVLNLASKEYAKAVQPYLQEGEQLVEIIFGQLVAGKPKVKATLAKMARGQMVRYLAEHQVTTLAGVKAFNHPDYQYAPDFSTATKYVFLQKEGF